MQRQIITETNRPEALAEFPRTHLVQGVTPLSRLNRLSDRFGVDLWIKRDDLAGPTLGGNKARQLEFYLGDALEKNADTVLITGAVQSNFVRTAAACANSLGMRTIVQLENRVSSMSGEYHSNGNVFLNSLLNAEIVWFPEGENEEAADQALEQRANVLRESGRSPYVIHLGEGHPPLGALGYVRAAWEFLSQDSEFDAFVVASGSGATHTGLLAGLRIAENKATVVGSCVRRSAELQKPRLRRVMGRLIQMVPEADKVSDADYNVWDGALHPGYGKIGQPAKEAMELMAVNEGILLDPAYTAKTFAAIPALLATGEINKGDRVCFWHTGGLAALFAYQSYLSVP